MKHTVECIYVQRLLANLEDKVVLEDKVGDAGHKNEDGWEDSSPQENDPIGLWQLHKIGNLEAGDIIYGEECQQSLQPQKIGEAELAYSNRQG